MATVNQIGSALRGTVGSGLFVGDTGPIITLAKTNNTNIGASGSTFTLNGVCGFMTSASLSVANGNGAVWTWNNTFITTTSFILVLPQILTGTSPRLFSVVSAEITGAGVCELTASNRSGGTISGTCCFNYLIF